MTLASLGRTKFLKISEKYRITSVNLPSHSINKFISPAKIKLLAANFSNFGGWFFKLCDIAGLVYSSKVISSVTRIFFDPESGNWDSWLGFYTDLMLSRISSMSSAQAAAAQHSLPFAWCHFKCKVPFPEHLITKVGRAHVANDYSMHTHTHMYTDPYLASIILPFCSRCSYSPASYFQSGAEKRILRNDETCEKQWNKPLICQ